MLPSVVPAIFLLPSLITALYTIPHAHVEPESNASLWQLKSITARQVDTTPPGREYRVLPVGDSITEGYASSDGNGYRLYLRNLLHGIGPRVSFIGSRVNGNNNAQNHHEGFGGYKIKQIQDAMASDGILFLHPNLVLIHAGTNDVWPDNTQEFYDQAPSRLGSLIDSVLCEAADAVVLVAKIVGNSYAQGRVDAFNAKIPGIVAERLAKSYKIKVVDMSGIRGSDLADGMQVHPNDGGYQKMAQMWFAGLSDIPDGWYLAPLGAGEGTKSGNTETCARDKLYWTKALNGQEIAAGAHVPGDTGEPVDPTSPGSGNEGGSSPPGGQGSTFVPYWVSQGQVAAGISKDGNWVRFADLDGDGRADYLWVDPVNGAVSAWLNKGIGNFQPLNGGNPVAAGVGEGVGVFLADMNNDKRDDYIFVKNDGTVSVYLNEGPYGNLYAWSAPIATMVNGVNQFNIIFGDLNGDGRADFLIIRPDGTIDAAFQAGSIGSDGWKLNYCSNIATSVGMGRIWLQDINGDGRDDFLSVFKDDGSITAWMNAPASSNCAGLTWTQLGEPRTFALGAGPGDQVRLADMDGDGKVDYLVVNPDQGATTLFLQKGSGGGNSGGSSDTIGGLGAAVRLADLDGDGRDDYISVGPNTEAIGYINGGQVGDSGWLWTPVLNGNLIALGHGGAKRNQIHFADINGDGRADYLVVDDKTGAVVCYYNGGQSGDGWAWIPKGEIAAGVGVGAGVRFADITGDGRADYIWLDEEGKATIYVNVGNGDDFTGWLPMNNGQPVAAGVGGKRQDIHFADIDGDGMADYLWIHPENGAVDVWYGGGPSGSSWVWWPGGQLAAGVGYPGRQVAFARVGTSGRADYVTIEENNGALKAYLSGCFQVTGTGGAGNGGGSNPLTEPDTPSGVGAGDQYLGDNACGRRWFAFEPRLQLYEPFKQRHGNPALDFVACSGSSTPQVAGQANALDGDHGLVTISVGGNDVGFTLTLHDCIFYFFFWFDHIPDSPCYVPPNGDTTRQNNYFLGIEDIIFSTAFHDNYFNMINNTISRINWGPDKGTVIRQTGYPQFFDDDTSQCSTTNFGIFPDDEYDGILLTKSLRYNFNLLVQQLNAVEDYWIDQINHDRGGWPQTIMSHASADQAWNGHRFCRADINEPDRNQYDIWFFNLFSNREDGTPYVDPPQSQAERSGTESQYRTLDVANCDTKVTSTRGSLNWNDRLVCGFARGVQGGKTARVPYPDPGALSTDATSKIFHPKRLGHNSFTLAIDQQDVYSPGTSPSGRVLRILAIGDGITTGCGSSEGSGYRKPLYDVLSRSNAVLFVGSQRSGTSGSIWERNEGYPGANVATLKSKVQLPDLSGDDAPNVIVIMAGTADVLGASDWASLLNAGASLNDLIAQVRSKYPDAVIIVAHIPCVDVNRFESGITAPQRRAIKWNANINAIVNRRRAARSSDRIKYVHTSPSAFDKTDATNPNDRGYEKIALDIAYMVAVAAADGWL